MVLTLNTPIDFGFSLSLNTVTKDEGVDLSLNVALII